MSLTITHTTPGLGAAEQPQAPKASSPRGWRTGWAALVATTLSRALIAAIGGLVSTSLLPALLGWHTAVVLSGSMEPRLVTGDIVVVRHIADSQLNPGQILLVHDPDHPGGLRMHRLVAIRQDGRLTLRGDANPRADHTPVAKSAVVGVASLHVPWIGLPFYWLQERRFAPLGFTLIAGAALFACAFLYRTPPTPDDDGTPGGGSGNNSAEIAVRRLRRMLLGSRRPARAARRGRLVLRVRMVTVLTVVALLATSGLAPSAFAVTIWFKTAANNSDAWSATNYFSCKDAVMAATPAIFYRLGESGPSTAADSSGNGASGTYQGTGTAFGVTGACPRDNNTGINLDGATGYISTPNSYNSPNTFTLETWFNTIGKPGGDLISFGTAKTGASPAASVDRTVYLNSGGAVFFSVNGTNIGTVNKYNDGTWHLVDAELSPAGMTVYLDGGSAAGGETIGPRANQTAGISETGYWRIGYDDLSSVASQHPAGSNYYGGSLDEVAIYNTALTAQQVKDHYYAS